MAVGVVPKPPEPSRYRQLFFVGGLYLIAVIWGVRNVYHDTPSALDLIVPLLIGLVVTLWCNADAKTMRKSLPLWAGFWLFLVWPIAFPAYLFWTRRWRGLGLAAAHGVGLFVVSTVAQLTAGVATEPRGCKG